MKIVAVSQRVEVLIERNEKRDALDQKLCQWIYSAGYVPVPVPNALRMLSTVRGQKKESEVLSWLRFVQPKAILLSGGNNIGDCQERDNTEDCLLSWARDKARPVLGICRGMQMMGKWSGVHLKRVEDHVCRRHALQGELVGDVNSFHDLALDKCPLDFTILAKAEDGVIEAIRHNTMPWEAWMWHPEREVKFQEWNIQRLKELFGE